MPLGQVDQRLNDGLCGMGKRLRNLLTAEGYNERVILLVLFGFPAEFAQLDMLRNLRHS
jgi:hypothetical protein